MPILASVALLATILVRDGGLEDRAFADGPPTDGLEYRVVSDSQAVLAIEERWPNPRLVLRRLLRAARRNDGSAVR